MLQDGSTETAIKETFSKFVPLVKVDEAQRIVYGLVTAEKPDQDGEVCDYASTAPYYKALNEKFSKATDGKSIAPLREMHQLSAVGVGKSIDFDETTKAIRMGFKVVDDVAWKKVTEGVYTGFSQGGKYVKTWKVGELVHFTADPTEISLVDNPCLDVATFEYVKADGSAEMRKFSPVIIPPPPKEKKEIAPEIDKTKLAAHLKKNQLPALKAATQLAKSMYDVQDVASCFNSLAWCQQYLADEAIYEGDDSAVPGKLLSVLRELQGVLLELVQEETDELLARADAIKATSGGKTMKTEEELQKAKDDLVKAEARLAKVKSAADHINKAMDHHAKMAECMGKAMECLGGEGTTEKTVVPVVEKTYTKEELDALVKAQSDELKKQITEDLKKELVPDNTQKVKLGLFGRDGKEVVKAAGAAPSATEDLQEVGI